MKAIRLRDFGDTPRAEDIPLPPINATEVLVRVEASSLNPLDMLVASGAARRFFDLTPPITLGTDFAGRIERVGQGVTDLRVGDRVVAWVDAGTGGGLAEYAVAPAAACVPLPQGLSWAEGSAIPTAGITAWHALFTTARLQAGETVLIHAAAGGVGSFAVQFAYMAGARVIATASGDGLTLARDLGAQTVVDYRAGDFAQGLHGVDVVLDLVGGETQDRSHGVLRDGGRLVSTVAPPDAGKAAAQGVSADMFYAKPFADHLGALVQTVAHRRIRVVLDRTVPFDRFSEAWERQCSGRARGKIVVLAQPSS